LGIPLFDGIGVFFKKRRYLAYFIVFVATTFLGLFMGWLLNWYAGSPIEETLVLLFAYIGSAGTIYFAFGSLLTGIGADRLWITRRGRGRTTELKGLSWMAVSFAISVFLSILAGAIAMLFFAMFCWVGWIAFQGYLSTRTSLRIATIAEPKKGGILLGTGSLILLLIGLGLIGAEALLALYLIPNNVFGLGTLIDGIFASASLNIATQFNFLLIAYAAMGLFALVMLISFIRNIGKGAALNIALLTNFIAIYAGYFLVNVLRRTNAFGMTPVDIGMSLFFLAYALSGIGRTTTEAAEKPGGRTGDFGPLVTFFLASGYFFVDSIIAVASNPSSAIWDWFNAGLLADPRFFYLFRDVAKLIAFPLAAIFTALYYLRYERTERIVSRAREDDEKFDPDEVDKEIADATPDPGEEWASEKAEGIKEGDPGHDLSAPDPDRKSFGDSRRLGKPKRFGEDDEDDARN
jgi:MFS family permease